MTARPSLALVAVLSIAGIFPSDAIGQKPTDADSDTALRALLTQHRDTLGQRVEELEALFADGIVDVMVVFSARDQLLDAELELAGNEDQRLALHRKRIGYARELEELTKARYQAGQDSLEATLSATAARLQAEIDLLREQE